MKVIQYIWVGKKHGVIISSSSKCPLNYGRKKISYLGFTEDCGYPKKLNTGRILYKPKDRVKKQKKLINT